MEGKADMEGKRERTEKKKHHRKEGLGPKEMGVQCDNILIIIPLSVLSETPLHNQRYRPTHKMNKN
jgi:hypothetical protein